MTKAEIRKAIQNLGLVAQWRAEWNEWRITVPPGSFSANKKVDDIAREDIAAYTDDDEDALGTARAMKESLIKNRPSWFRPPWPDNRPEYETSWPDDIGM